jgi:hypothetical protein
MYALEAVRYYLLMHFDLFGVDHILYHRLRVLIGFRTARDQCVSVLVHVRAPPYSNRQFFFSLYLINLIAETTLGLGISLPSRTREWGEIRCHICP